MSREGWRRAIRGALIVYLAVPLVSAATLLAPWFY